MSFKDSGHRPHAVHTGEEPQNPILKGPEGITVTLDTWGPRDNLFPTLYDMLQSNWGDAPSRLADPDPQDDPVYIDPSMNMWDVVTGWYRLSADQKAYVESLFAGRTLPQAKELITFAFTVDGVSRTCTHQLVRTRIGAAFMQHGGRDNDWRHRPWRMPETIRRACRQISDVKDDPSLKSPITDDRPLDDFIENWRRSIKDAHSDLWGAHPLEACIDHHIACARQLYAALVDAGIPWQDARFLLPDGMTTYIHCNYNYAALEGVLANRLEHIMQWEINCVAQLMLREIKIKCPPILSKYLGSRSDKINAAALAGLESWPPDGKHPVWGSDLICECGHTRPEHFAQGLFPDGSPDPSYSTGCQKCNCPEWREKSIPRTHRPEQNPFWVLHPDSMAGGPVRWIPTNGTYPKEF